MARTYRRDGKGRFSGGGGGGGGGGGKKGGGKAGAAAGKAAPQSKGAATKAADKGRAADLKAKGTTGLGGRIKAKGFAGKKAVQTAGGLRSGGEASTRMKAARPGTLSANAGKRGKQTAMAAKSKQQASSRAASKGTKKMAPSPASPAKARYKELSSASRKRGFERTAGENKKAAGAKRSLASFVAKRGVAKRK